MLKSSAASFEAIEAIHAYATTLSDDQFEELVKELKAIKLAKEPKYCPFDTSDSEINDAIKRGKENARLTNKGTNSPTMPKILEEPTFRLEKKPLFEQSSQASEKDTATTETMSKSDDTGSSCGSTFFSMNDSYLADRSRCGTEYSVFS